MGYILPITNHQYNAYQNRIMEDKRIPQNVEKPFKVVLEKRHQELTKEYDRLHRTMDIQANKHEKLNAEKMYNQLTGKGIHFNKVI